MKDKLIVEYVARIAKRDNYGETVVATCRHFPHYSSDYLIEIIRAVYHFNRWLKIKHYSRPARKLAQNEITYYQKVMDELYEYTTTDPERSNSQETA